MNHRISTLCFLFLFCHMCGICSAHESCVVMLSLEDHADWNAYSTLFGTIVIGQWMRDLCASEDELAAIVMHEKAHLKQGHNQ